MNRDSKAFFCKNHLDNSVQHMYVAIPFQKVSGILPSKARADFEEVKT